MYILSHAHTGKLLRAGRIKIYYTRSIKYIFVKNPTTNIKLPYCNNYICLILINSWGKFGIRKINMYGLISVRNDNLD